MPKRTIFTNITPLPPQISREVAVAMLHDHDEMIELNPLVIEHHSIRTPRDAPADEFLDCVWQELTDKIHYLPGGIVKGKVSYKACFHDLPRALQTHIYAPLGLDIREKWSIGGTLPGEYREPRELGLDVPGEGLYLREDCDMSCSRLLTGFVRKNLDQAHKVLVERILKKAELIEEHRKSLPRHSLETTTTSNSRDHAQIFQAGSHMSKSRILHDPSLTRSLPRQGSYYDPNLDNHPAFRTHDNNSYQIPSPISTDRSYSQAAWPYHTSQEYAAELPGSSCYETDNSRSYRTAPSKRFSIVTEMSGSDVMRRSLSSGTQSDQVSSRASSRSSYSQDSGYPASPASNKGKSGYETHHSELPGNAGVPNVISHDCTTCNRMK